LIISIRGPGLDVGGRPCAPPRAGDHEFGIGQRDALPFARRREETRHLAHMPMQMVETFRLEYASYLDCHAGWD
jgi:hypothetical protein